MPKFAPPIDGDLRYEIKWSGKWIKGDWLTLYEGTSKEDAETKAKEFGLNLAILRWIEEIMLKREWKPEGTLFLSTIRYMLCDSPGNDREELYPISFGFENIEPLSVGQLKQLGLIRRKTKV